MAYKRDSGWENDSEAFSEPQVEALLEYCGIDIITDTATHFICLCPFHGNTDTPAFAVDKFLALYTCFNPSCMRAGTMVDLIRSTKGLNPFQAQRLILKNRNAANTPLSDRLSAALVKPVDFVEFPQATLDKLAAAFKGSVAEEYMRSRGFDDETLDYFNIGYSASKNMVTVPMHDPNGMPIGIIGRSPSWTDKIFKNSVNLPKSKTAWNFHRAKQSGETVIICEASYDAMRIHQAGYPNVIALLGGSITSYHVAQINRHFSSIVIMTDFDKKQFRPNCRQCDHKRCVGHRPGRELGRSIAEKLSNKKIRWAVYDDKVVFPHHAKDASDMTDDEIRYCLKNAIPNFEYAQWNVEAVAE